MSMAVGRMKAISRHGIDVLDESIDEFVLEARREGDTTTTKHNRSLIDENGSMFVKRVAICRGMPARTICRSHGCCLENVGFVA